MSIPLSPDHPVDPAASAYQETGAFRLVACEDGWISTRSVFSEPVDLSKLPLLRALAQRIDLTFAQKLERFGEIRSDIHPARARLGPQDSHPLT